jgi:hypothetical protein
MVKLATINLTDKVSGFNSGAAFSIRQTHNCSKIVELDSGWEIEVDSNCPYVVIRAKNVALEDLVWMAYEAAQEGLDILSSNKDADLSIQNSEKDRIIWWNDGKSQFLRITSIMDWPYRI